MLQIYKYILKIPFADTNGIFWKHVSFQNLFYYTKSENGHKIYSFITGLNDKTIQFSLNQCYFTALSYFKTVIHFLRNIKLNYLFIGFKFNGINCNGFWRFNSYHINTTAQINYLSLKFNSFKFSFYLRRR